MLKPEHVLDITSEVCPMTYVRTKLKLESLPAGAVLAVLIKGDEPLRNIPRNVRADGHEVLGVEELGGGVHRLVLRKGKAPDRRRRA